MIEVTNISKSYADILAVDRVSVQMRENTVFGLIGTNGAGKSTVLRMIAGVLKADEGSITVDGIPVFDQVEAKKKIFFIADEPYFFANANARCTRNSSGKTFTGIWKVSDSIKREKSILFPKE